MKDQIFERVTKPTGDANGDAILRAIEANNCDGGAYGAYADYLEEHINHPHYADREAWLWCIDEKAWFYENPRGRWNIPAKISAVFFEAIGHPDYPRYGGLIRLALMIPQAPIDFGNVQHTLPVAAWRLAEGLRQLRRCSFGILTHELNLGQVLIKP